MSDLRQQVEAALDAPCGCAGLTLTHSALTGEKVTPPIRTLRRLRDCPTCLPERIAAVIVAGTGDEYPEDDRRALLRSLRGER